MQRELGEWEGIAVVGTEAGNFLDCVWGKWRYIFFSWTLGYIKGIVGKGWEDVQGPDGWGTGI